MRIFVKSSVFCGFLKTPVFWVTRSEIRCSEASEIIKTANRRHPRLITNIDHEKSSKNRKITRKNLHPTPSSKFTFFAFLFCGFLENQIFLSAYLVFTIKECVLDPGKCGMIKNAKRSRLPVVYYVGHEKPQPRLNPPIQDRVVDQ